MFNLTNLFEESTGLYSFYKWCRYADIPKELIFTTLVVHKRLPNCIYCAMGCCANWPYNTGHHYNGTPLHKIVRPFFDKLDTNARGKIIVLALSDFRHTMLQDARMCLDELFILRNDIYIETNSLVSISTFDYSYSMAFSIIGSALHDVHDIVNDHPHKKKYQNKDELEINKVKLKSYFHRIRQYLQEKCQPTGISYRKKMTNTTWRYGRLISSVSSYLNLYAARAVFARGQLQIK